MSLSDEEKGVLAIMQLNKVLTKTEITKKWYIGRLQITFNWRSKKNLWGRFGGGWNWKLGLQVSGTTVIVNLFIFSLCFYLAKAKKEMK